LHLLSARSAPAAEGEAVDLGQTPGEIVIASCAETEIAGLVAARRRQGADAPSLRLVNLQRLRHPLSVDRWVEQVVAGARTVLLRLLGGRGYWHYVLEQVAAATRASGARLIVLPGDDRDDPGLEGWSTVDAAERRRIAGWLNHGGPRNLDALLAHLARRAAADPLPLPRAGLWRPAELAQLGDRPRALVVFYRALVQAGTTAALDALAEALAARGLEPVLVWVTSLKDPASQALLDTVLAAARPQVLLNATSFATSGDDPLAACDRPVLQVVLASGDVEPWLAGPAGLAPADLAMGVVLPELDGRVMGRAISFKARTGFDELCQCPIVEPQPIADRVEALADLAAAWARLGALPASERRVALVLSNYPIRDGRLANGVGLDTPESVVMILRALAASGHATAVPASADALMRALRAGPTNTPESADRPGGVTLPLADYRDVLAALPAPSREALVARWGPPEVDPFVRDGRFVLPMLTLGNVVVGLQPSRGYELDPERTWHDPALVPPHRYLAFYAWLRRVFRADALVHVGKHGTLEWLPGKPAGLSAGCWPEAVLGPLPVLYPFIVNDPGEGAAAKRRISAVIVDHLTPPLTRAGTHGALVELERLLDELSQAQALDAPRAARLRREILAESRRLGLDRDIAMAEGTDDETLLLALDRHLCELKELQIRDGLHVLGRAPAGRQRTDLLVALVRSPRGAGSGADASLTRALAADLGLTGFDPLTADPALPWDGARPEPLARQAPTSPWRIAGDTIERLEILATALVAGEQACPESWTRTVAVLRMLRERVAPALDRSAAAETEALLAGLDGRRVAPGPSGAPTRGRLDVLPTGRNFHAIDARAVPTPTAWQLGWRSAGLVLEHHRQTHGEWPARLVLSAWGTATMRTGGDDIAQALAFLGCRPVWDTTSGRVTGVEVLPLEVLDRPRVDVTLRVSGLFRDAFPAAIELVDDAVRAVAALDEPAEQNPLAAAVRAEIARRCDRGEDRAQAARQASFRVFGSRPGAYGAGLQALIDTGHWRDDGDLAAAFLAWGGWAYGRNVTGEAAAEPLGQRLARAQLVVHNQDNREHDLLDSDDYYQFEGGLAVSIRHLAGRQPEILHNDHSLPERPVVRTLRQEIARIVRGRAANPRWIEGVMRHGYKGAFEIAATVDYLFAFAATARVVEDHHFDQLFDAYLDDPTVRAFLAHANPDALREIALRFQEAVARGLWHPAKNSAQALLDDLAARGPAG
jgi:cobaltochelatase CobN